MRMTRHVIIIMAFGLLACAVAVRAQTNAGLSAAAAQPSTNDTRSVFQCADTNCDGRVNLSEFTVHMQKSTFEKLDADNDGEISLEEWKAVDNAPGAEKRFAALDKDKSGRISYPEFIGASGWQSAMEHSFSGLDRDRDSHLAPDELTGRPMFRLLSVDF